MKLERSFTYRLHRLHKLTDVASQSAYEHELGLTIGEGRCLAAIGSFPDSDGFMSIKELAHYANLDKSQASRSAQMLINRGLVVKAHSEQDARTVALKLTRQGLAKFRRSITLIEQRNHEIFGALNATQSKALSDALDVLLEANAVGTLQRAIEANRNGGE
jgi:DNA-binding MarR family transcriptional regulator